MPRHFLKTLYNFSTLPQEPPKAPVSPETFRSVTHGKMGEENPSIDQTKMSVVAKKAVIVNARPSSKILNKDVGFSHLSYEIFNEFLLSFYRFISTYMRINLFF